MNKIPGLSVRSLIARYGLVLWVLAVTVIVAGCAQQEDSTSRTESPATTVTTPATEAPKVVKDKCSLCHGLKDTAGNNITEAGRGEGGQPALKGQFFPATPRPDWTATIERMRNQNKCEMTDDEAAEAIKYLNDNYGS